ncbi:alpha/beta fold hydrolase [Thorsellia anophelis]|uniref:Lysophospholipase n=1 Tax=Thorsellia anophelis DSM 18579 TaxID=1123402 RepID=A0A1I0CS36_9GAMM|nr:alpha/beta fold hydrolase [Thorsellia anophelis]SET22470.1 lysophospholipase [Thorsellia anophelis DSM 18579]
MSKIISDNLHYKSAREEKFEIFSKEILDPFWEKVEKLSFNNSRGNRLAFARIRHKSNNKAIFLVTGRVESYLRYKELIYDIFHEGYDVYCLDHIGQGLSDRIHEDSERGHVEQFGHYVDDLIEFYQNIIFPNGYNYVYAIAHSMGGGILAHSILKMPNMFKRAAFCAPMFGINIPLPDGVANTILNVAERYPVIRDYYALGTGRWRALPFALNRLTHSKVRYEANLSLLNQIPSLKMGGPTYHWVKESKAATLALQAQADKWQMPSLVLQAEHELLVCNESQQAFVAKCAIKPKFILVENARHELLMESDDIRVFVLDHIFNFFKID